MDYDEVNELINTKRFKKDLVKVNLDNYKPRDLVKDDYTLNCLIDLDLDFNKDLRFYFSHYFRHFLWDERLKLFIFNSVNDDIIHLLIDFLFSGISNDDDLDDNDYGNDYNDINNNKYIQSSLNDDLCSPSTSYSQDDEDDNKAEAEKILINLIPIEPSKIFNNLITPFKLTSTRIHVLEFLLKCLSTHSIHSHILIKSNLFKLILKSSLIDQNFTLINLINLIISILLPKFPLICSNYISYFLAFIGKILIFKRRKDDNFNTFNKFNLTLRDESELKPINSKFLKLFPTPTPLFTFLYGIFPSNTLSFLREPIKYLIESDFQNPFNEPLNHWLFVDLIKARSLPLLRTHLIHPFFLKYPLNDPQEELEQTGNRWPDAESQAILAQCSVLEINAATIVEFGRRIAEGFIEDTQLLNSLDFDQCFNLSESNAFNNANNLSSNDLMSNFIYEQYIKGQLLMRLGQLHRRRLAEARDEDAQQSLYIHLHDLSDRLNNAQLALSNARSEAAKTHARHVTWTDELQKKIKLFRDEKKNWDAEAVFLRGERSASEEIIRVNLGRLADSGNKIFELENLIREWKPKIEKFEQIEDRNRQLVKSLAERLDISFTN